MQDRTVSEQDTGPSDERRFTTLERVVLVSGLCVLTLWIGALVWIGYRLFALIA